MSDDIATRTSWVNYMGKCFSSARIASFNLMSYLLQNVKSHAKYFTFYVCEDHMLIYYNICKSNEPKHTFSRNLDRRQWRYRGEDFPFRVEFLRPPLLLSKMRREIKTSADSNTHTHTHVYIKFVKHVFDFWELWSWNVSQEH